MKNRIKFLTILLLGLIPFAARAQQLPVLTVQMTEIDTVSPGPPPTLVPAFGSNANAAGNGPTNSGNPLNGGAVNYGQQIVMWALATGTAPASGFTYTFYVNGISIGVATPTANFQDNYGISWIPPQPGVYFLSVVATDGAHTAVSPAIQFYALGIEIVNPVPGTNLPVGSSVVVQAATAVQFGAISSVNFYDESGLLGTSRTYPYSIIYTPTAVNPGTLGNIHYIYAKSYNADGSQAFDSSIGGGSLPILMVTPVGPIPLCTIGTPQGSPSAPYAQSIPDYVANAAAYVSVIVNASSPQGNIQQVQLYVNGALYGTLANYPYNFKWTPTVAGKYNLTALAYDDKNNVIASTTSTAPTATPQPTVVVVGPLPSVAIISPSQGSTVSGGGTGTMTVKVSATDSNVTGSGAAVGIVTVQVYQDGNAVGSASTPDTPGGSIYSISFTPKQKVDTNGNPVPSNFFATANDSIGFTGTSQTISATVNLGGTSTSAIVGTPPTVSLVAPLDQSSVIVNSPVTLSATAQAMNTPGNVSKVVFLVDNTPLSVTGVTAYPYSTTWVPTNLGTYSVAAQVTDNDGNVTTSKAITVTVVTEPPPVVSVTNPVGGTIATVSSGVTVNASASSPSGTIASVQFYENGSPIGTAVTTPPYTASFVPLSEGVYTITAKATDSAGETTVSSPVIIEALPATSGLGTTAYFGQYQGLKDGGRFAFIVVDGTYGTYIGHSTSGAASTAFYSGIPVSPAGTFSTTNIKSGSASVTGVSATLSPSQDMLIGSATTATGLNVPSGYFTGNVAGQAGSQVTAIVGLDGEIMVYFGNGSYADVADGSLDSTGAFTITTSQNNTFTGKIDSNTGFLTGTLSGSSGGSVLAAKVSGGTFSDGAMTNISTRGPVASGANAMITGFYVGGTVSKQVLIRAVGPGLTGFGLPGAVSATQLQVFNATSTTPIYSNTGWDSDPTNAASVSNASPSVGAFALQAGSKDSALVATLPPGAYTAQVTGVGSATGIALAEVYDLDSYAPFSAKKLINISTRGNVGTGTSAMIGGFHVNGTAPKRLLIRGTGPGLTQFNVSGVLAAPHLQLFNGSQALVRENYAWQTGNDGALVAAAAKQTGAFAFANGSNDTAILAVLPPGTYTAEVSGVGSTTGIALVEVYEIP